MSVAPCLGMYTGGQGREGPGNWLATAIGPYSLGYAWDAVARSRRSECYAKDWKIPRRGLMGHSSMAHPLALPGMAVAPVAMHVHDA